MTDNNFHTKIFHGISILIAYTMINPVIEDLQDVLSKPVLYHPLSIWICIVMMVYLETRDISTGIITVIIYEIVKILWRQLKPEPPIIGNLRKLIHRIQNEKPLSDDDILFLNKITPKDVKIMREIQ